MPYYQIRYIGDYARPYELNENLFRVFERDGKFYFTDTYTDDHDEISEESVRVYETKAEAWFIILKELDTHIKQIQAKRDEMFQEAIKDGYSCITSDYLSGFIDKRMNEVK